MKITMVAVLAALSTALCMALAAAGPAAWVPIPIPISEAQNQELIEVNGNELAESRSLYSPEQDSARTFGGPRKRLMMLLPVMYKLGVITTMLSVLVFLAVKSVGIGLLLLALGAANLAVVTKIKAATGPHHGGWEKASYGGGPIHVHVHTGKESGHHQAYASYHPPSGPPPSYSSYSEPYPQEYHYRR